MKIAVIVPVFNGGDDILACLGALMRSTRIPDQLLIVDDGSTDGAALVGANQFNASLLTLSDGPAGPARARNRGVAAVDSDIDILVFIDADVLAHETTLERIEQEFLQNPQIGALFGSYDDNPTHQSTVSRYRNLLHHHVHQTSKQDASTFWAGCGAVRYSAFHAVGGFAEHYGKPSIEDIEFGVRLKSSGAAIRLCPEIQVTHLKHWTLGNMIRTDVFARAIPWTHLLSRSNHMPNDLNLTARHRINAALALLLGICLLLVPVIPEAFVIAAVLSATFIALEYKLFRLFRHAGGWWFATKTFPLHVLYNWYASAAYVYARLQILMTASPKLPTEYQASGRKTSYRLNGAMPSSSLAIAELPGKYRATKDPISKTPVDEKKERLQDA